MLSNTSNTIKDKQRKKGNDNDMFYFDENINKDFDVNDAMHDANDNFHK